MILGDCSCDSWYVIMDIPPSLSLVFIRCTPSMVEYREGHSIGFPAQAVTGELQHRSLNHKGLGNVTPKKLPKSNLDLSFQGETCSGKFSRSLHFWRSTASSLNEISKYIALILRLKPEAIGISLDEHDWADVSDLIGGINRTHFFDMAALEKIVSEDSKQRYSFNEDKTLIRANQGHSIPVDVELEECEPPQYLYHGTGEKYCRSIEEQGLLHKSRLYVHLSTDVETADTVGRRHGKPVVYRVWSGRMHKDGFHFYKSVNGVWLTEYVPTKYIKRETVMEK